MNYYEAREISDKDGNATGKFRFTVMNDKKVRATGACLENCPDGHDTKVEACDHYREGELKVVEFKDIADDQWPKHKCEAEDCEEQATVRTGPAYLHLATPLLCKKHATKEEVSKKWGTGEFTMMSS